MPELKLLPLSETLGADQISELSRKLTNLGADSAEDGDDAFDLDESINEDQLTDFMDRLEAHDVAADIYLPVEFEGRVSVGDQTFGSAQALAEALEELREELDIDGDDDNDDEEIDLEMIEEQLSHCWRIFTRAVNASIEKQIPLHIIQ